MTVSSAPLSRLPRGFGDRLTAGILTVIGVVMFAVSLTYGLIDDGQPQPGLFPAVVSGGLVILSVAWLIVGPGKAVHHSAMTELAESVMGDDELVLDAIEGDESDSSTSRRGKWIIAFTVLWALVPILLLDRIGFVLTMTLYVGGMMVVIARVRWWLAVPITAVVSLLAGIGAHAAGIALPDPLHILPLLGV